MNLIEKILGLDSLCGYMGETVGSGPEYECVPLITLQSKNYSLAPGYTLRKYWDKRYEPSSYHVEPWDGPIGTTSEDFVPVMIPFPQRTTNGPRALISLLRPSLVPISSKINYLNVENIKEVDKFDFSRLGAIVEHVKTNGVLTITLSDMESACVLLSGLNRNIIEKFRYCIMHYSNHGKANTPPQHTLMLHITFMDLNMCIPIFDSDSVDGVGVLCEYMYKSPNGEDYSLAGRGMAMVLSNKPENIITVDGTLIGEHRPPGLDLIKSLIKVAVTTQQQAIKADDQGSLQDDKMVIGVNHGSYVTNYTTSASSTSTSYY